MPLVHLYRTTDTLWGIWHISEDEATLSGALTQETVPPGISNPYKRLEFLSARLCVSTLLSEWGIPYSGMRKDEFGKPFLKNSDIHVSLSHSYPYVAAILHKRENVGIDLEQPKEKLLRIAPRVLAPGELRDAGDDLIKHCIYWCAKESLVKIHGKKDLIFCENLRIDPFDRQREGTIVGRIVTADSEITVPLSYLVSENFVMVVSSPATAKKSDST